MNAAYVFHWMRNRLARQAHEGTARTPRLGEIVARCSGCDSTTFMPLCSASTMVVAQLRCAKCGLAATRANLMLRTARPAHAEAPAPI